MAAAADGMSFHSQTCEGLAGLVEEAVLAFYTHARDFDALYAGKL
jgi:hypothetical protein